MVPNNESLPGADGPSSSHGHGGAARVAVDKLDDDVLAHGGDANRNDGKGVRYCNGMEL